MILKRIHSFDLKILFEIAAIAIFILTFSADAVPVVEWSKTFGGAKDDSASYVQQTSDGGYIIAGSTNSYGAGDAWIIKRDEKGNEQWSRNFGGKGYDEAVSIQQTSDGGYILTGSTSSYGDGDYGAWIIKTNASGIEQWNRSFGRNRNVETASIQQTSDRGYIIAGSIYSYGSDHYDAWMIKTDVNGIEQWNRTIKGPKEGRATSVQQIQDSGFIVAGWTDSYSDGRRAGWLIRTDVNGIEKWNQTFIISEENTVASLARQTSDGGFMLLGRTVSYTSSNYAWLVKTDPDGLKQWEKIYGGSYDDMASSGQQTKDGGYVITGGTWRHILHRISLSNAWVIKTDGDGNEIWNMTLRKSLFSSVINSGQQTADNGYILAGITGTYGIRGYDAWLIKLSNKSQTKKVPAFEAVWALIILFFVLRIIFKRKKPAIRR